MDAWIVTYRHVMCHVYISSFDISLIFSCHQINVCFANLSQSLLFSVFRMLCFPLHLFVLFVLSLVLLINLLFCYAETEQGVAQAIIRSVIDFKRDPWPKVSDNAKDLVKKMLDPDPKCRLTAQEVLGRFLC